MDGKILSITIPSYNVESVVEKCIDSMLAAGCAEDIEILAVNDGSTDNTESILMKYQEKFPNTVRVINKENGGHGSAINAGIKNAKGKYFKVIDGDDWVIEDGFKKLVDFLKECDSDAVGTDFYFFNENTGEKREDKCIKNADKVKTGIEYHFDDIADSVLLQMHALTIKTDILRDNKIVIDEKCFYVDVEYIIFPVPYIDTITIMDNFVYMYRVGQLNQSVNIKNMQNRHKQHRRVMEHLIVFLKNHERKISENKYNYIFCRMQDMLYMQYKIYMTMRGAKAECISFDRFLMENNPKMYKVLFDQSRNKQLVASMIRIMRKTGYCTYGLFNALMMKMEK